MTLVRVCPTDAVPEGEVRRFDVDGRPVALANCGEDGFRAIDAVCSHAHYHLDEGELDCDLGTVECPKHGSTFDLATGKPRSLPATVPVAVYPVKIENDDVWIEVHA
jgi:3-phenylpropionate/trans-cinnamate dioxygenase ferredoxin component